MRAQTPSAYTPSAYAPPPVASLCEEERLLLKAARMWVLLARSGRSPRPCLQALLGPAAARFSLLMDIIIAPWPDPFTTFPPCAATLSPDEHSLLRLLALAGADDEPGFHAWLADLLSTPDRARLWRAACRMTAERMGAT